MKSSLLGLALAASLTLAARADEMRRITLDGRADAKAPAAEAGADGIDRIHKVEQPQLVLLPATNRPARGTVLLCPGGGYAILAVNHEGYDVATMLNGAGWDVAVLLYRVSEGDQTRTLAFGDAKQALALLQKRGAEFGLETKRIGVMGFSAGGHLAARTARSAAEAGTPPDCALLIYPAYLNGKDGKVLAEVAPTKVPAFIYVAADDPYCASSRAFEAAAREAGLPCEAHFAASGGHGFGMKKKRPAAVKDWPDTLRAFLDGLK